MLSEKGYLLLWKIVSSTPVKWYLELIAIVRVKSENENLSWVGLIEMIWKLAFESNSVSG